MKWPQARSEDAQKNEATERSQEHCLSLSASHSGEVPLAINDGDSRKLGAMRLNQVHLRFSLWRESILFSQNHQAVSAERPHRQIGSKSKAEFSWNPCHLLHEQIAEFDASRSKEIIDNGISHVHQGAQSGFLGEIV